MEDRDQKGSEPGSEAERELLERRAAELARPELGSDALRSIYVVFELAGERFGLVAKWVFRVLRDRSLTPVPLTDRTLVGLTVFEGEVLAVFDIRELIAPRSAGLSNFENIVVVGRERAEFGVLVDKLEGFVDLEESEIIPSAQDGSSRGLSLGVSSDGIVIVDGARLVVDERLKVRHV